MKNRILNFEAVMLSLALINACSKDEPWKELPNTPISGEQATLTVNGQQNTSGSITLIAKNSTQGTLLLKNMLPGYSKIEMDVKLAECSNGTFDITGEKGLTTPSSFIARAEDAPLIFQISATGNISPDGTAAVDLTSVLNKEAQGGLTGTWNLLTNLKTEKDDNENTVLLTAPFYVKWTAQNKDITNAEEMASRLNSFASGIIYQFLHSVTFSEDGNITAEFWSGNNNLDIQTILNYLMNGVKKNDDGTAIMDNLHPDDTWSKSPKNLVSWYVSGEYLYVIPAISAIIGQISQNGSGSDMFGDLTNLLTSLNKYGIKVSRELLSLVVQWLNTGIPLKYQETGNGLKLYADKEMCRPVIEALLPALPELDKMIKDLENSENPMMQMIPSLLPSLLAIDNLSVLGPIWKENTKDFEVSLNFEN